MVLLYDNIADQFLGSLEAATLISQHLDLAIKDNFVYHLEDAFRDHFRIRKIFITKWFDKSNSSAVELFLFLDAKFSTEL